MVNDHNPLKSLASALVAVGRSRLNQGINVTGHLFALRSSQLVTLAVVAFLGFNLFLFLNIALGFYLGDAMHSSPALGFLILAGIYVLLIGTYLLIRKRIEERVRNRVARRVAHLNDVLNQDLNRMEALRVDESYREAYLSSEPQPYRALELRRDEAAKQARRATETLKQDVDYLKRNYAGIATDFASSQLEQRYPIFRLLPILFGSKQTRRPSSKPTHQLDKVIDTTTPWGKIQDKMNPIIPYLHMIYKVASPIVSTFVLTRAQSWLLGGLMRLFTRRGK